MNPTTKCSDRVSHKLSLAMLSEMIGDKPRSLMTDAQWASIAHALGLSRRELQTVQGILDGEKEMAIALELGISVHTVHTHVEHVYRKLGIGSRCALVILIFVAHMSLEFGFREPARLSTDKG